MKTDSPILSAVLDDDAASLRETTRRQVVALARHRRRARAIRRGLAAGAAVVLAGMWLRPWGRPAAPPAEARSDAGVVMVASHPLEPGMLVRTGEAGFEPVRGEFAGIAMVASRPLDITITETRLAMPAVDFLDDRELLAAFPGGRAALIDAGTPRARLIFY